MSNPWKLTSKAMLNDGLTELRKCASGSVNLNLLPGEAECILHEITRLREADSKPNRVVIEVRGGNVVDVRVERPEEILAFLLDWDEVETPEQEGKLCEGDPFPVELLNCIKEEA